MNIFDYTIADLKEYMKSSGEKNTAPSRFINMFMTEFLLRR